MFFKISNKTINCNFPFSQIKRVNDLHVALDKGWVQHGDIFYKGYCIDQQLEQKVRDRDFSEQSGNYVILDFTDKCAVHHDDSRSFPMCHDDDTVSNHKHTVMKDVWFDGAVQYENGKWKFVHRPENVIKHPSDITHLNKTKGLAIRLPSYGGRWTTSTLAMISNRYCSAQLSPVIAQLAKL